METYIAGTSLAYIKIEELKLIGLPYTLLPGSLTSRFANLHVSRVKLAFMFFHSSLRCLIVFHTWGRKGRPRYPVLETLAPQHKQRKYLDTQKRKSRSALFTPSITLFFLIFFLLGCSFPSALSHFNHREISGGESTTFYKKAAGGKTLRLANLVTGVTSRRRLSYMSMASKLIFLGLLQLLSVNRMQQMPNPADRQSKSSPR
jgi:hypothetical protein